jgi:acyl-CoA thioester hydrolase
VSGPVIFDFPAPHLVTLRVQPGDIDAYGHVNNAIYLSWFDQAAWSHSAALGAPLEHCLRLRRGMAAQRIEVDYLRAARHGDEVQAATWIVSADQRLRAERRFQIVRLSDASTLARARVDYVCINLDSGRAARMPELFVRIYVPAESAGG